jgi:hypothetical protein
LCAFGKEAVQAAVVGHGSIADGPHQGQKFGAQIREQGAHRRAGHALVRVVDQRIDHVLVGGEERGVFAAEIEGTLQQGPHAGKIVVLPRPRPGIVGGRGVRARLLDEAGRNLHGLGEIARRHADEGRIVAVGRQALLIGRQLLDEAAETGIRPALMQEPAHERALPSARVSAGFRHIGGLVP